MRHPSRRDRATDGFTLVEVVATVTILAIVIVPLALAASQAIKLVPQSRDRSGAAIARSSIADRFGDDVANATSVPAAAITTCDSAGASLAFVLPRAWDGSSTAVRYRVAVASSFTAPRSVTVSRDVGTYDGTTFTPTGTATVARGWCASGTVASVDPVTCASGAAHASVKLTLAWRDSALDTTDRTDVMESALRTTC